MPIPDGLEHRVGEAQRQDVLHRLLAEVVVDPEDRLLGEDLVHDVVELPRAGQVVTERLLDDHPAPGVLVVLGQPGTLQLLDDLGESLGRDRQVEGVVTAGAAALVELLDRHRQRVEGARVAELARDEVHALRQVGPDLLAERRARVLLDRLVGDLPEVLVLPVAAGEAHQRETGRQQPPVGQVVDGGQQFLTGEVAGHAEQHEHARPGHPGDAFVARIAQRVDG
jgi:hypothetical protein